MSHSKFKGKSRGENKDESPGKRPLDMDFDFGDKDILMMKEAFELIDPSGTGEISKEALAATLDLLKDDCEIGVKLLGGLLESGKPVTLSDFLYHMIDARGDPKSKDGVEKIFSLIDNGEGKINAEGLKRLCNDIGVAMTDEEIQETLSKFSSEGYITSEQFLSIMIPKKRR